MTASLHPFERAGLGVAPFRCMGVKENRFEMPGFGWKPGGCCAYCGTGILYEYQIRDRDGRDFVVGSTCVERTGAVVNGFREVRAEAAKTKRQAGAKARREERDRLWAEDKERRAQARAEGSQKWRAENSDLVDALKDEVLCADTFVRSMRDSLNQWGSLTDNQAKALRSCLLRINSSMHLGKEGERIKNLLVRVTSCRFLGVDDRFYPPRRKYLVSMVTESGSQLVWWTGSPQSESGTAFEVCDLTVKSHSTYRLVNQTTVLRVKFKS